MTITSRALGKSRLSLSTLPTENTPDVANSSGSDNETTQSVKEDQVKEIQYPHGLKAVLLASASVVAVFLIGDVPSAQDG